MMDLWFEKFGRNFLDKAVEFARLKNSPNVDKQKQCHFL